MQCRVRVGKFLTFFNSRESGNQKFLSGILRKSEKSQEISRESNTIENYTFHNLISFLAFIISPSLLQILVAKRPVELKLLSLPTDVGGIPVKDWYKACRYLGMSVPLDLSKHKNSCLIRSYSTDAGSLEACCDSFRDCSTYFSTLS